MILYAFLTNNQTIKNKPQDDNVHENLFLGMLTRPYFTNPYLEKSSTNLLNSQMKLT